MLKSIYHTGFVVQDVEKSLAFYTEVMGLKLLYRTHRDDEFVERVLGFEGAHIRGAFMSLGNGHALELIQYIYPPSAEGHTDRNNLGATHLAFKVENLDQYYATMSQKGLRFVNPPAPLVEDGVLVRKAAYCQDPDGNWLEFVEFPE